jgi:hypothetical protein
MFWANIGLIGGNVKIEGFGRRLYVALSCRCVPVLLSDDQTTRVTSFGTRGV